MTGMILCESEYNEIMFEHLLYLIEKMGFDGCFDVAVLKTGNTVEMRELLEKCGEKKNIVEFIKYYRMLRQAKDDQYDEEKIKKNARINAKIARELKKIEFFEPDPEQKIRNKELRIAKQLVNEYDRLGYTPLMMAVVEQNLTEVQRLLKIQGIQVNKLRKWDMDGYCPRRRDTGNTALGIATRIAAENNNKKALDIKDVLLKHPRINTQLL
jgi:hypothetical protein